MVTDGRRPTDNDVKLALITQVIGVVKWLFACILLGWLAWVAKEALVEFADDSDKPPWERITTLIITAVMSLLAPSGLFCFLYKHGIPLIRSRLARVDRYERQIDPGRTSSETDEERSRSEGCTPLPPSPEDSTK